ncbi:hypothetical protein F4679DRAFT_585828 [Xylaria curta]|nr:hypothetical protein F4679DRAFT_585828 [Xylaria curta]
MLRQSSPDGCGPSTALVDTLAESLLPPIQTDAPDDTNCPWLVEGDQNDEDIDDPWWSTRQFFRASSTKSDRLCYEQSQLDEKQEEVSEDQMPLMLSMSPSMFSGGNLSQQDDSFQQRFPYNEDDGLYKYHPVGWTDRPDDFLYGSQPDYSLQDYSRQDGSQQDERQENELQEDESDGTITPPYRPPPPGPDQLPIPLHIKSKRNRERRKNVLRIRRRREIFQNPPPKDDSPGQDDDSLPTQDRRRERARLKRKSRLRHIAWPESKQSPE